MKEALPPPPFESWDGFWKEEAHKVNLKGPVPNGGGCEKWWCCGTWWAREQEAAERAATRERAERKEGMVEPFDVWIRKRAVANPRLYGPQLAAEGMEIMRNFPVLDHGEEEVLPPPVTPALVNQEPLHVTREELNKPIDFNPPEVVDIKAEVADHDDAEVVEDLEAGW